MIARITKTTEKFIVPTFDVENRANEADVGHKLATPFLTNEAYLGIPSAWARNQEFMIPTDICRLAGKRHGYKPPG